MLFSSGEPSSGGVLGFGNLPDIRTPGRTLPATYDRAFAQLLAAKPATGAGGRDFQLPPDPGSLLRLRAGSSPASSRAPSRLSSSMVPRPIPAAVGTIPEFYDEISGGRVTLTGTTFDWAETALTQAEVTAGVSGLGNGSKVGEFIVRILEALDDGRWTGASSTMTGPTGFPTRGTTTDTWMSWLSCIRLRGRSAPRGDRPNRIWSHRWNLYWNARYYGSAWTPAVRPVDSGQRRVRHPNPFGRTRMWTSFGSWTTPSNPSGTAAATTINHIGVFAHELGHGFGLPDLYVTSSTQDHEGIGNWGLMGTGSWGCDGRTAWSPCHMSAWSKEVLGWADIQTLDAGSGPGDALPSPGGNLGEVYRINSGDGSPRIPPPGEPAAVRVRRTPL